MESFLEHVDWMLGRFTCVAQLKFIQNVGSHSNHRRYPLSAWTKYRKNHYRPSPRRLILSVEKKTGAGGKGGLNGTTCRNLMLNAHSYSPIVASHPQPQPSPPVQNHTCVLRTPLAQPSGTHGGLSWGGGHAAAHKMNANLINSHLDTVDRARGFVCLFNCLEVIYLAVIWWAGSNKHNRKHIII